MFRKHAAGLSWITILRKREALEHAFAHFIPQRLACYSDQQLNDRLKQKALIRNRAKIYALRQNAQSMLNIQE
jgi:DNA-3-methyladenine glycosylase I